MVFFRLWGLLIFCLVFFTSVLNTSASNCCGCYSVSSISNSYRRLQPVSFSEYLPLRAVNNTVLMNLVDYGYINMWNNSYIYGNLSSYDNLVVVCMDKESYWVMKIISHLI